MDLPQVVVRAVQFVWTLLITALLGNVMALNHNGHMVAINFTMFVAALSWVSILYGIVAAFVGAVAIPLVLMVLDGLTALFTFIDAIVLAALLTGVNCNHYRGKGSGWIGWGASDTEKRCREIQASTAFMWFLWATVTAGLAFAFMGFRRAGASSRSGNPSMSQV